MIASLMLLVAATPAVSVEGCDQAAEIARIAEIELRGSTPLAAVRCEGDNATLRIDEHTRTLELKSVDPRARPRLIALALAELAAIAIAPSALSAFAEPQASPPVKPAAPQKIESQPTPPIAEPSRTEGPGRAGAGAAGTPIAHAEDTASPPIALSPALTFGILTFTEASPIAFGGRAGADVLIVDRFGARFDLGAHFGTGDISLGRGSLLSIDGALAMFGRLPIDGASLTFGVGARVGWARLRGEPADSNAASGASVAGIWFGPSTALRFDFGLDAFSILVDAELGLVVRPVVGRVLDLPEIAADGGWIAIHAGVELP